MFLELVNLICGKPARPLNQAEVIAKSNEIIADKFAECKLRIENEKDPVKKQKMINRLALGNTDFSNL